MGVGRLKMLLKECKEEEGIHPLGFQIHYLIKQFPYKPG